MKFPAFFSVLSFVVIGLYFVAVSIHNFLGGNKKIIYNMPATEFLKTVMKVELCCFPPCVFLFYLPNHCSHLMRWSFIGSQ